MPRGGDRLELVQALRGIAAAAVMLYHGRVFVDDDAYRHAGSRLFGSGYTGVDLFFVISGFIMVYTTRDVAGGPRDAAAFLVRRFARIWPVYAVILVTMWILTRPASPPAYMVEPHELLSPLAFVPQEPREAAPFFGYPPLLHAGWTLVYEIYFYICFAVALATGRWRYATLAVIAVAGLVVWPVVATGRLTFDAMTSYGIDNYGCIVTSPIVWDFAFGVLIGLVHQSTLGIRDARVRRAFIALALAVVVAQYVSGYRVGHGPSRSAVPMAVLVLALVLHDRATPMRMPRWLVWLGDVSFSLYLVHILPHILPKTFGHRAPLMDGAPFLVLAVMLALVLAFVSHRWLERGLSEWVRRRLTAALRLTTRR